MSEAVEWIAFGRVPEMQHEVDKKTGEVVDYRFYWREMPDNFQPSMEYPWFDRLEFQSLGVPIVEEYFEAAERCAFESVDSLPQKIAENEAKEAVFVEDEDGSEFNLWEKIINDDRKKLAELEPLQALVDEVESAFSRYQEIACAKLFQLLAGGQILSEAIDDKRWELLSDNAEYQEAATFEGISPGAFSLSQDWMSNELYIEGKKYVALRVKTQELLDHRATLFQSGERISVERFGAFYVSGNAARTNRKAPRGRRWVVDWFAMKSHLSELALRGELPEGKENCIYELIAFAEGALGKSPSRTAVQRNMAAELNAHYA